MDQVTEMEGGCLEQLKGAIVGVVIAPILMIVSCAGLFWNEGRAVKRHRDLQAGKKAVVPIDKPQPKSENDGKLIHTTGELQTDGPVADEKFGVSTEAVRLERVVEMYQWIEEEEREEVRRNGETRTRTTYTYRRDWSDEHHDSSRFHEPSGHENPSSIPFNEKSFRAETVELGGFTVDRNLLDKLETAQTLQVDPSAADSAPGKYAKTAEVSGGELYLDGRASNPKIGDVRVRYRYVPVGTISVVAGQSDGALTNYSSEELYNEIGLIEAGVNSPDGMFETAEEENQMLTWGIRGAGFFMLLAAFMMLFSPLEVLAGAIPGIGWIVDDMVEAGTFLISLLLSVAIWTTVVALGWLTYRPLIGIPLLLVALAAIAGIVFLVYSVASDR